MGNADLPSFSRILTGSVAATICALALSGCMTLGKGKETAKADIDPATPAVAEVQPQVQPQQPMTAAEQLAASLNAKAEAQMQKPGGYRDPLVRTANGQQMVAQQSATALYPAPMPQAPGTAGSAPANIGGLVTQPTAVNANRSSIYSAPPPIMVNPDGTLAGPVNAYSSQGAAPAMRSVYSTPMGMNDAPQPQAQQIMMPATQAPQGNVPQYASPPVSAAEVRPTADATPHRVLPVPGSKQRTLSSQEALTVARNAASQGKNPSINASIVKPGSGLPMGMALPEGVTLTPGMSALLKQPI